VGKTQLALEYAYRHADDYRVIWWVRAEEPVQLAADYAALATPLDLAERNASNQSAIVSAVREWLERTGGWLLIFDNAPAPASVTGYLPRAGGGHVLITSRDQNWGRTATTVAVPVLPQAEAVALLEKRTGWSGPQVAVLADELGQLPLALEQAAAYAAATGCSLNTYLELFHSRRQALLRREEPPEGYQGTVATTWSLAMVKAGAECPAAAGLLNVCAYLAPDEIPLSLLQEGAEFYPEPLAAAARDPLLLHDAVAALRRYSLVTVHEEALSVNRLVQAVVRDGLREEEQRTWAAAAVRLVNAGFPPNPDDVRNWPGCALRLSHALAATALAMGLLVAAEETAGLLGLAASYLNSRADHEEARACARRALEFVERVLGPEHPAMIWRLEGLAGMGVDTRPLLERALAIAEKVYGADHPEVARRLLPLGAALRWVPDEPGAKACYERALAIAERAEGPEGLLVAEVRLDLSMVLGGLGDFAGAKEQAERALAIFEKTCPPDYGRLASAHMGLGLLSGHLAEFAQEKAHYEQALRIAEKAYGPDHPEVGWRLVTLGRWSLRAFGDLATAKAYQERGLQIYEKAYGPDHPRMGGPLISLAETLRLLGDPGDAKTLVERALAIEGKTWGEQDPESLRLLGSLLLDLGDLQTAPSVLARAQEAAERPDRLDPELKAAVYLEVGRLHHLQGDLEGAKVFLKQSLAIPEAMCPPHQFRMAATHQEYGLTLQALGDPAGAREHLTQAVTMFESQIGPKHPRTQRARRCLAALDTGTN
jgi:tetratricopeptide (TPR) repeat protein